MAKNREPEKAVYTYSSEDDDDDDSDSSEEDEPEPPMSLKKPSTSKPPVLSQPESTEASKSKEVEPEPPKSKMKPSTSKHSVPPQPHSTDGSKSKEVEPEPPKSKTKPSTPRHSVHEEHKRKKPEPTRAGSSSKQKVAVAETEAKAKKLKSNSKRPASEDEKGTQNPKKKRKDSENGEAKPVASEKKQLIQRIWSQEDEIILLKCFVEFKAENKVDPFQDIDGFLAFIKDSLHMVVTKSQLQSKLKRLKKKYLNNKSKEKNGKEKSFSNPHEKESYRLSKLAWGTDNENSDANEEVKPSAWGTENWIDSKEVEASALMKVKESVIEAEDKILVEGDHWLEKMESMSEEEKMQWKKLLVDEINNYIRYKDTKTARAEHLLRVMKSDDAR